MKSSPQITPLTTPEQRLPTLTLISFSLPCVIQSLLFVPVMAVFPTIYEKYYAVNFAAIGIAMTLSRGLDSVLDPIVAYLSDRTRTVLGARKPWLLFGAVLAMLGIYKLFLPTGKPDALYFLIWSSVVYFAWSIMQVPHDAWATEMSGEYNERSRIFTFKGTAAQIGSFAFLGSPILLAAWFGFESTEMTPAVMHAVGSIALVLLPAAILAAVVLVPQTRRIHGADIDFKGTMRALARNGPYRLFLLIFGIQGLALGIYAALLLPFIEGFLRIGDQFSLIMVVTALFALVSMPPWLWAAKKFGKHVAWAAGSALSNVVLLGWLFVPAGEGALLPTLVISAFYGFFSSCAAVCYPSILGDINDYGLLKSRANRPGTYFAGVMLLVKLTSAVGGGLALALVGWFGFSTQADAVMTQWTRIGVLAVFIGLHTVLQLIAVVLILRFPLDQRRHAIISRRLERLAIARSEAS
jgi:GPH family glycoside/pentoside/hexuronide:cation symporter